MLGSAENTAIVRAWLARVSPPIVVLDPVLKASIGQPLGNDDLLQALVDLLPSCDVVTPNLDELAALISEPTAPSWDAAIAQAQRLSERFSVAVLVTGGHLGGPSSPDALVDPYDTLGIGQPVTRITTPRIATMNTHGTGCSLSAALATNRALLDDWVSALDASKRWLTVSLQSADDLDVGHGPGPLNHLSQYWEHLRTAAGPVKSDGFCPPY